LEQLRNSLFSQSFDCPTSTSCHVPNSRYDAKPNIRRFNNDASTNEAMLFIAIEGCLITELAVRSASMLRWVFS
jgi:hypothetical protein